jgi:hypothetical protein
MKEKCEKCKILMDRHNEEYHEKFIEFNLHRRRLLKNSEDVDLNLMKNLLDDLCRLDPGNNKVWSFPKMEKTKE